MRSKYKHYKYNTCFDLRLAFVSHISSRLSLKIKAESHFSALFCVYRLNIVIYP